jgi:hypothetical protein
MWTDKNKKTNLDEKPDLFFVFVQLVCCGRFETNLGLRICLEGGNPVNQLAGSAVQ